MTNGHLLECAAGSTANASIHSDKLNTIARLALVDEVVVQNDVCAAWQLTRGRPLGHFLDADPLVIPELAVAKLCFDVVVVIVFLGDQGCRGCFVGDGGGRVPIVLGEELLRRRTVMDGPDDLGSDQ